MKTCRKGLHQYEDALRTCPECKREANRRYESEKRRETRTPEKRREWDHRYNASEKAREAKRRYNASEKGREATRRYIESPHGFAMRMAYRMIGG